MYVCFISVYIYACLKAPVSYSQADGLVISESHKIHENHLTCKLGHMSGDAKEHNVRNVMAWEKLGQDIL